MKGDTQVPDTEIKDGYFNTRELNVYFSVGGKPLET